MLSKSIKAYFLEDRRLSGLLEAIKPYYLRANLPNHNLDHVTQVLYRALLIVEKDNMKCDRSLLIAAALIHDIGYTLVRRKFGHEKVGADVSNILLTQAGFNEKETGEILSAILNYFTPGYSQIADVLYDADVLNMAGHGSAYYLYVSLYEYRQFPEAQNELYEIDKHLESRIKIMQQLKSMGMRTTYGKKLLGNGFAERIDDLTRGMKGLKQRPDLLVNYEQTFE